MSQTTVSNSNWWLRLTAPPGAQNYANASTYRERDRLRKAQLTSIVAPLVFLTPLLLLQQASDPGTLVGILLMMAISVGALVLNRIGKQQIAALLLILSMDAVIEGSLATAGGLGSGWLLTFALFAVPLVAVGVLLSRHYIWLFMGLHIILILGDFYLLPHTKDLEDLVVLWHGPAIAFARPIIIQIMLSLLTFVAIRSTDQAIARADRAEELAALERAEVERKRQIEISAQQLLEVHAKIAQGNYQVRANVPQGNVLWDVARSLNNMLVRIERDHQRANQAAHELQRTRAEAQRLVEAIDDTRTGRIPLWPGNTGTVIDPITERLKSSLLSKSAGSGAPPSTPQSSLQQRPPIPPYKDLR